MPQKTGIEWTDYSSNPIYAINRENGKRGWFCTKPSAGCGHCYSEALNVRRFGNGLHYTKSNIDKVKFILNEKELKAIIRLDRSLGVRGQTAKLFPCDMTDLFLEQHPDEFLDKIFAVFALCPNITFQLLTKRPERMREYCKRVQNYNGSLSQFWLGDAIQNSAPYISFQTLRDARIDKPLSNVWLGVSVEDQKTADERIPILLQTPAAVRWISAEPLLGPIDFRAYLGYDPVYETEQSRGVNLPISPEWRDGDSGRRNNLEGKEKGLGSLAQNDCDPSLQTSSGRELDGQTELSSSSDHDRRDKILLHGSSPDLVSPLRPDSRGIDDKSQERHQDGQPCGESRVSNQLGTNQTCPQDRSDLSGRPEESRSPSHGQRSGSDSEPLFRGTLDAEADSRPIQLSSPDDFQDSSRGQAPDSKGANSELHPSSAKHQHYPQQERPIHLDQIIVGGESGTNARPFGIAWARSIIRQCKAAGVPVFMKQLGSNVWDRNDAGFEGDGPGSWPMDTDTDDWHQDPGRQYQGAECRIKLRDRKGGDMSEWPDNLRIREFPQLV